MKRTLCLLLTLVTLPGFGATFEVGPTRAHKTLQEVAGLLNPGDTVWVDGASTYPGDILFTRPGAPGAPITIKGLPAGGLRPVLSGGTNTVTFQTPWPYDAGGADHYILEGFEVTGGSSRGIFHQADDLTLRDILVRDCPAHGILGADEGSGSLLVEHCEVRRCGSGDSRHQIYMATDEVNHPGSVFRMQFCFIHDGRGGNNVKSRAERNEIYYNWIEGAYYHELELIGPDGGDGGNPALKREDSDVVGNVLLKKTTSAGNDANFSVTRVGGDGTGETFGRYRFVNNTILSGTGSVFRIFDGIESIEMHNNVLASAFGGLVKVKRTAEANWASGQETIAGFNNWVTTGAEEVPIQWTGTFLGTDPGFTNGPARDLRPAPGSPLLDAGTASPQSPPGYLFPNPLFPPAFHPPSGEASAPDGVEARPSFGALDIGAYEWPVPPPYDPVVRVDSRNDTGIEDGSSLRPFRTIQSGLDAASTGETVRVAMGTYGEDLVVDSKSLVLLGGYGGGSTAAYRAGDGGDFESRPGTMQSTVVNGSGAAAVILLRGTNASGSTLDRFRFTGGLHGIEFDTEATWPHLSDITISDCLIEGNGKGASPPSRGGGISISGQRHRILRNVVRDNRAERGAGIGRISTPDGLLLEGNEVSDNVATGDHGAGIYLDGEVILRDNLIRGNRIELGYGWGGGVLILGKAHLSGNTIRDNYAPSYGGGMFVDEGAEAWLDGELITGNSTQMDEKGGAGVAVDDGEPGPSAVHMKNCTVADNRGGGCCGGNGVFVDNRSTAEVTNCIFWGNGDDFYLRPDGFSSMTVTYTLSCEGALGIGNFTADPLFAGAGAGNYRLRSKGGRWDDASGSWVIDADLSPAIDAGDPAGEFSAEPAPNGGRLNLGFDGNTARASKSPPAGCTLDCAATATPTSGQAPLTVSFEASAQAEGCGAPPAFLWEFGDGTVSPVQNPVHKYTGAGDYDWALTVSVPGLSCTRSGKVTVTPPAVLPGDCNGDGAVSIGEVQGAINMFLGIASPVCGVDCNGDGTVSIGEVQKVINAFLGFVSECS
jgi:hypothetical protein